MSLDSTLKTTEINHLNSLGGNFLYKLTQHRRQVINHYVGDARFAYTTLIWEPDFVDVVQVHRDYVLKCTPRRLSSLVDVFAILKCELRKQNIKQIVTFTQEHDSKLFKYWCMLGLDLFESEDGSFIYGSKEL